MSSTKTPPTWNCRLQAWWSRARDFVKRHDLVPHGRPPAGWRTLRPRGTGHWISCAVLGAALATYLAFWVHAHADYLFNPFERKAQHLLLDHLLHIDALDHSGNLLLEVEDTISGNKLHPTFDMVVLATGVVPNTEELVPIGNLAVDDYGFLNGNTTTEGIYAAGCAKHPCDVSRATKDATAAALKAIQCLTGGGKV